MLICGMHAVVSVSILVILVAIPLLHGSNNGVERLRFLNSLTLGFNLGPGHLHFLPGTVYGHGDGLDLGTGHGIRSLAFARSNSYLYFLFLLGILSLAFGIFILFLRGILLLVLGILLIVSLDLHLRSFRRSFFFISRNVVVDVFLL